MDLNSQFRKFDDGQKNWRELFQKLDLEANTMIKKHKLTTKIAISRANSEKNRYTNVLPYDQNRVKLVGENDYVNASFVTVYTAKRNYILSQGPVEESVVDFWQMIFENNVPAIIMLNRIFEGGSLKCEKYFPDSNDPVIEFHHYLIQLEYEEQLQCFISRKLIVKNNDTGEQRTILHIQYTEWPDFGVPVCTSHFLEMLNYIKNLQVLSIDKDDPPVVVHCSAGIGRSGTWILVDSVIRMNELGTSERDIDPNALLVELRSQRMGLIQTPEQLRFAWAAIIDGLKNNNASGDVDLLNKITVISANDVTRKRRSDAQEELDEKISKRRELVANMVRKSRQCEEGSNKNKIFSSKSLLIGGVVAVASIFVYYYFRR